jgi:hypothetical protein
MTTKHKTTTSAEPESTATPSTTAHAASTKAAAKPAANSPLVTSTGSSNNRGTKVDLQAQYQSVIAGLLEYYAPTDPFHLAQGTYTRDELIAEFQSFVSACQTTKTANQAWRTAVQSERTLQSGIREVRKGVRGIVQARFGAEGAQNLQFGFTLVKTRKTSSETKAIAVEKGKATRKERGTLGSVQKKKIKGNVNVAIVVTPGPGAQDTSSTAATTAGSTQSTGQAVVQSDALANAAVATPVTTGAVPANGGAGAPPAAGH